MSLGVPAGRCGNPLQLFNVAQLRIVTIALLIVVFIVSDMDGTMLYILIIGVRRFGGLERHFFVGSDDHLGDHVQILATKQLGCLKGLITSCYSFWQTNVNYARLERCIFGNGLLHHRLFFKTIKIC